MLRHIKSLLQSTFNGNNGHHILIDAYIVETGGVVTAVATDMVAICARCVVFTGRDGLTQHMQFVAVKTDC